MLATEVPDRRGRPNGMLLQGAHGPFGDSLRLVAGQLGSDSLDGAGRHSIDPVQQNLPVISH